MALSNRSILRYMASSLSFFFFNDTAATEFYSLSLHDALPILADERLALHRAILPEIVCRDDAAVRGHVLDRKSTRLNSSHPSISYAVFCLKKKNRNFSTIRSGVAAHTNGSVLLLCSSMYATIA